MSRVVHLRLSPHSVHVALGSRGGHQDGGIVLAWPFAPEAFAPKPAMALLAHGLAAAFQCSKAQLGSHLFFARIDVRFEGGLESSAQRDDIARALWGELGERLRQDGRPLALVNPPGWSRILRSDWHEFVVYTGGIAVLCWASLLLSRSPTYVAINVLLFGVALGMGLRTLYRQSYFRTRS